VAQGDKSHKRGNGRKGETATVTEGRSDPEGEVKVREGAGGKKGQPTPTGGGTLEAKRILMRFIKGSFEGCNEKGGKRG